MYKSIPTYKDGNWEYTDFKTKEDFKSFLLTLFKEPGQYRFDEIALLFNEQANRFNKDGFYCNKPFRSKDYVKYALEVNKDWFENNNIDIGDLINIKEMIPNDN